VHTTQGRVRAVDFVNVPSFQLARSVQLPTSRGAVDVDISFGGAIYANVPASSVGLRVVPEDLPALIAAGREIKRALADSAHAQHPSDPRLSGIYGTIFYDELGSAEDGTVHQRNVAIFADGEVDRSPCGSGTCARVAALTANGQLTEGGRLRHESIVGSSFDALVLRRTVADEHDAVIVQVTGMAYKTGAHTFEVDADDALVPGFVLR
jgi:proline racemase